MNGVAKFVLYSHIYTGICAASLYASTLLLIGSEFSNSTEIVFVYASTVAYYLLHRFMSFRYYANEKTKEIIAFTVKYQFILTVLFVIHIGIALVSLYNFPQKIIWHIATIGLFSVAYTIPISIKGKKRSLRHIGFLKILWVAVVWVWMTTLVPMLLAENIKISLLIFHFLLILLLLVPFEIRDAELDQQTVIYSIINTFNEKGIQLVYWFGIALFFTIGIVMFWQIITMYTVLFLFILCISVGVTYSFSKNKSEWYYLGIVDGIMLLEFFLLYILL